MFSYQEWRQKTQGVQRSWIRTLFLETSYPLPLSHCRCNLGPSGRAYGFALMASDYRENNKSPLYWPYTGLLPINWDAKVMEDLPCVVMGGNLSSLHYWSAAYGPLKREHILVIETWDDATRMDSILLSLKLGDFFENTKAIIFGSMHGKTPGDEGFEEIQARCALLIRSFAEDLGIPVFSTKPSKDVPSDLTFGHGPYNDPIPFGTPSTLRFDGTRPGFTLTMAVPPLRRDSPQ